MDRLENEGIQYKPGLDAIKIFRWLFHHGHLGAGGTRFGRFPFGGEPRSLEEKYKTSAF